MTTIALKKDIHKAVENTNDSEILKAVRTILKRTSEEEVYELTPAQKRELDKRLALHKAGKAKYYSLEEVRKNVLKALAK